MVLAVLMVGHHLHQVQLTRPPKLRYCTSCNRYSSRGTYCGSCGRLARIVLRPILIRPVSIKQSGDTNRKLIASLMRPRPAMASYCARCFSSWNHSGHRCRNCGAKDYELRSLWALSQRELLIDIKTAVAQR